VQSSMLTSYRRRLLRIANPLELLSLLSVVPRDEFSMNFHNFFTNFSEQPYQHVSE
jgi:hypothetical protein